MEWDLDRSSACRVSLGTLVALVAHVAGAAGAAGDAGDAAHCTVGSDARLEPAASEKADRRRHR